VTVCGEVWQGCGMTWRGCDRVWQGFFFFFFGAGGVHGGEAEWIMMRGGVVRGVEDVSRVQEKFES
jgi:hypothetical protein